MRSAAFLDRDGTIIVDSGFVADPARVTLIPGAAAAVRRLNEAGHAVVVVTNQSGIARGLLGWDEYRAVAARMEALLAEEGARIDASYACPHYPPISGPCECRKPGLASYRDAIGTLGIDPTRSIFVGDRLTDLEPGSALGGRGILVETGDGAASAEAARAAGFEVAADLAGAVASALGKR